MDVLSNIFLHQKRRLVTAAGTILNSMFLLILSYLESFCATHPILQVSVTKLRRTIEHLRHLHHAYNFWMQYTK